MSASSDELPPLAEFATRLFSSGNAVVRRDADLRNSGAAQKVLEEAFAGALMELAEGPGAALEFVPEIALESLRFLYRLCLALSDRSMADEEVLKICATFPAAPTTSAEALSADLTLQHLPSIHQVARAVSEDDPLLAGLSQVAARFPLSSVGIALEQASDLTLIRSHRGLWQLYVDRILERQDVSLASDPEVKAALREALGLHRSLAPKLASHLSLAAA
jgi:hypothetical protein